MNLPPISIVTISYGHQDFIIETIKGVVNQVYDGEIEFIIANDNSPDNTDDVVKKYLKETNLPHNIQIKYTKHSTNLGMMPNFFWALDQAMGKYIALCEGDDFWTDPYKLQKQVDFMESNPEFSLCFHKINYYNNFTQEIERVYPTDLQKTEFTQEEIAKGNFIPTLSILFRNYKNEIPMPSGYKIGDYPLYLFLASKGKAKFLDFIGATYRSGVGSFNTLDKLKQLNQVKETLDVVVNQSFLSPESRKNLNVQRINYGARIGKNTSQNIKYINLLKGKKEFTNFNLNERILIFLKILLKK